MESKRALEGGWVEARKNFYFLSSSYMNITKKGFRNSEVIYLFF